MSITVTATQGGSTSNGMALRVKVLTNIAATQNGATANNNGSSSSGSSSITTTTTGSFVYGSAVGNNVSATPATGTTQIDNIADATNGERYCTFRTTSATGTPGSVTVGDTNSGYTGCALLEVLPSGTITEDASGPAAVSTTSATTVTTAAFTPPAGSLLVAMVSSDGGAAVTTMTVSGGGLTWTEKVKANGSSFDYCGVWIAAVPAATSSPPLIQQSRRSFSPSILRKHGITISGLPVAVQPAELPASVRAHFPYELAALNTPRKRQNADIVVPPPLPPVQAPFLWDAPRYPQHVVATLATQRVGRRIALTGLPVPIQPPYELAYERRWSRPPWPRHGIAAPTGWAVPVQPPYSFIYERRWSRPLLPRRGVVPPSALPPVLVQTGYGIFGAVTTGRLLPFRRTGRVESVVGTELPSIVTSERVRLKPLWPRRGETSPYSGLPVPVQPPERMQFERRWSRPLLPRKGVVDYPAPPPVIVNPIISYSERRFSRPLLPRRGVVASTGWPVTIQPTERMQSVRRWSLPPLPRRGVSRMPAPPPVTVNPLISSSERRWSRPLWPHRGVVPPTGLPTTVQPPERMQYVRRLSRVLLLRRSVVTEVPTLEVLPPEMSWSVRERVWRIPRYPGRPVISPQGIPVPIRSVQRPNRFRTIIRFSRTAPGAPVQPPPQFPLNPEAMRRKHRFIPYRRGNVQPTSGLPVPVQPTFAWNFIRRWIKPLFPRRGTIPSNSLPYVAPPIPASVVPPGWTWISQSLPNVEITQSLPRTRITIQIS